VGGSVLGGALAGASITIGVPEVGEIGIAGVVIGVIIFVAGFLFFRHGSEVTEGDIVKPYQKPLRDAMGQLQKMGGR
jgi:hypothetical protein